MEGSFKELVQKATHSDERSQYSRLKTQIYRLDYTDEEREVYAGSPLTKLCIHVGSLFTSRIYVHTHFHKSKSVYTLES